MQLYEELLAKLLQKEALLLLFSTHGIDITNFLNPECYQTLQKIKVILKDSALEEHECFEKIEQLIQSVESTAANNREHTPFH